MTYLISKFCLEGETVLEFCMETGSVAKTCLLAPKHVRFSGCKGDDYCHSKSMPSILKVFVRQILSDASDINERKGIQEAARWYKQGQASA